MVTWYKCVYATLWVANSFINNQPLIQLIFLDVHFNIDKITSAFFLFTSVWYILIYSVQFSHSVVSDCLRPHGLQHARLPCPSPALGACSNSRPSSQQCHPIIISSSVIPFSSRLQSFPALGLFQWVSSSHQGAKVLAFQLQHQSFQWIFRTDFL